MGGTPETTEQAIRAALTRQGLAAARLRSALGRRLGLTETEVLAIQQLGWAGRLTPSQLTALVGLSSGGGSALVQRLERAGHVEREPHPIDRRSTVLRLTAAVRAIVEEVLDPLARDLEGLGSELSEIERVVVARFLARAAEAQERCADALGREAELRARAELGVPVPGLWG
jgi:DNA-binding MarR family transcriptional regulator